MTVLVPASVFARHKPSLGVDWLVVYPLANWISVSPGAAFAAYDLVHDRALELDVERSEIEREAVERYIASQRVMPAMEGVSAGLATIEVAWPEELVALRGRLRDECGADLWARYSEQGVVWQLDTHKGGVVDKCLLFTGPNALLELQVYGWRMLATLNDDEVYGTAGDLAEGGGLSGPASASMLSHEEPLISAVATFVGTTLQPQVIGLASPFLQRTLSFATQVAQGSTVPAGAVTTELKMSLLCPADEAAMEWERSLLGRHVVVEVRLLDTDRLAEAMAKQSAEDRS